MPHIASSFVRPGRRAGGRRWSQIMWSRRRRLLKATTRAETAQRLQEEAADARAARKAREHLWLARNSADSHERAASEDPIVAAVAVRNADITNKAKHGMSPEGGDASSAAAAACTRPALPSPIWRPGYVSTVEAMATPFLAVPHTPKCKLDKRKPAATPHERPFTSGANRSTTAPPEKKPPCNIGSVSGRRTSVLSSEKGRWRRRGCDAAVAPRLHTIAESEGSLYVTPAESYAASDEKPRASLVGAENHRWIGNSKWGEEDLEEEDGKEEEGEGASKEAEEEGAEVSSKGKDNVDVNKAKEKEEMTEEKVKGKGTVEKEEVGDVKEKREKVRVNEKEEEGEEKEEMEEEQAEAGVKEERGEGEKKMEEEGKMEEKEVMERKEWEGQGEGEARERGVVEEGGGVGVKEEKVGEESQPQEHQQEEQEESVTAGVRPRASPIVDESSVVVYGVPEASSVTTAVAPLGVSEARGSLVPAEFRPSERKDDVLCTWDLSMISTKADTAILGAGAFGSVIEVQTQNGRELAMKTVVISDDYKRLRIRREAELLQECSAHPYVVDMHGSIDTNDRLYIIMSKADTTLLSLMQAGVVDEARAAECIRQLMSATDFLHSRRIIHRDIKPANVLLRNGQVLLADFGLAKRTEGCLFAEKDTCGTMSYLAPELIIGVPYGLAVDMWAIGVVTFELLHGVHPFWPNTQQAKLAFGNAEVNDAGSGNNGANRVSESSLDDSSGSSVDDSGSSIEVGEDAGPVVDAGEGGGIGGGALSSGTGVGSTSVSSVEDAPSPVFGMSPSRAELAMKALLRERIKAAKFDVNEDLDPVARDFLDKLLQRLSPYRMTATQAAKHPWLNRPSEIHAVHAWRSSVTARTITAMAVRRASRLDAAVFKAERAAERAEGAVRRMKARAEGSSVLGQSTVTISARVAKATRDVVSTLRKCAKLATLMAAQTLGAQKPCAPSDMQVGNQGLREVGSTAEHMAEESVRKAERFAGEAEVRSNEAAEAVALWEGTVAEAEEEAAEAIDAAEAAAAVEAMFHQRRAVGGKRPARKRKGKAQAVR